MLLETKTYAFTHQKVAFWKAKGMLLQSKSIGLNKASVSKKEEKFENIKISVRRKRVINANDKISIILGKKFENM